MLGIDDGGYACRVGRGPDVAVDHQVELVDGQAPRALGHRASNPPEMRWTAPEGIDVPECGLWNLRRRSRPR